MRAPREPTDNNRDRRSAHEKVVDAQKASREAEALCKEVERLAKGQQSVLKILARLFRG